MMAKTPDIGYRKACQGSSTYAQLTSAGTPTPTQSTLLFPLECSNFSKVTGWGVRVRGRT